eukprot:TRINITY_DN38438_c0_g1_i1.p2 TRINITY_DN38438_c0_g1~~TRINITY_DN38438_c0_g1_i1.p2  ORF type:complete len:260 (-),score=66.46 TRINITY_DN38438_c0_g1_i1:69-848(-)
MAAARRPAVCVLLLLLASVSWAVHVGKGPGIEEGDVVLERDHTTVGHGKRHPNTQTTSEKARRESMKTEHPRGVCGPLTVAPDLCSAIAFNVFEPTHAEEYDAAAQEAVNAGVDAYLSYVCDTAACKKDLNNVTHVACEAAFKTWCCANAFPKCEMDGPGGRVTSVPACATFCVDLFRTCVDDNYDDPRCANLEESATCKEDMTPRRPLPKKNKKNRSKMTALPAMPIAPGCEECPCLPSQDVQDCYPCFACQMADLGN